MSFTKTIVFGWQAYRLWVWRFVWVLVALASVLIIALGVKPHYEAILQYPEYNPRILLSLGLPTNFGAIFDFTLDALTWVAFMGVAVLLFTRQSADNMTWMSSIFLMAWGMTKTTDIGQHLVVSYPEMRLLVAVLGAIGDTALVAFIYTLPDGRFFPKWTRYIVIPFIAWTILYTLFPSVPLINPSQWSRALQFILPLLVYLVAFWVSNHRYHHYLRVEQRQQTKWIIYGLVAALSAFVFTKTAGLLFPQFDSVSAGSTLFEFFLQTYLLIALAAIPLTILFSVWQYRLWDVDLIINRSITTVLLVVALLVAFVLQFTLMQVLLRVLTGGENSVIALIAPVLITAITFDPLRRRAQSIIDRNLYGLRFDQNDLQKAQKPLKQGLYSGQRLGDYDVLEIIGKGGMGEVYKAKDADGKTVALKLLHNIISENKEYQARFEREARMGNQLSHAGIIHVDHLGESNGLYFLVMQYVDGITLSDFLKANTRMSFTEAVAFIREFADALDYAHRMGYVHRDIKPSNILLASVTSTQTHHSQPAFHPVLTDFGVAKTSDMTSELTGSNAVGTISYMAPEQIVQSKTVDYRADIYALGVMTYELLTGEKPFTGIPAQVMFAHLQQPAPNAETLVADLPKGCGDILMKAMAKKPEERYESAGEMADALAEWV